MANIKNICEIRISQTDMDRLETLIKQGNEFIGVVGTIGILYGIIAKQKDEIEQLRDEIKRLLP